MTISADMWVHAVRERKGYRFRISTSWDVGRKRGWAERFLEALLFTFLFPFLFLFSFKTLVFWLQNDSNKFVNFSNIQNNISRQ
jgi:hypothetical protein